MKCNINTILIQHRLPKVDLTTFDDKYDKWLGIYNSFKSIVNENKVLLKIQKLHYLRSCLTDEAASIRSALRKITFHESWC